jgi:hypothetical protein
MHTIIHSHLGRIFHAAAHPGIVKTRPTYAFVPEEFFDASGFRKGHYLISRWPSINMGANPLGIGSHVIPDPALPAHIRSKCPILREFINRLEIIAAIKAAA